MKSLALILGLIVAAGARAEPWFPCLVQPFETVDLSTAVAAVVTEIRVAKGDRVARGDVLVILDAEVEKANVAYAKARVALDAAIKVRESRLDLSQKKLSRARDLSGKNYIAQNELDELVSAVNVAEQELEEARESRRLSRLELPRAQAEYAKRILKSPIDGIVVERLLAPGEFAQAQPIMTLAQLHPLRVEVVLPVTLYGTVAAGSPARIRLPDPPIGGEYDATVTVVEQVIDAGSGTFGVRLELPNDALALPAGLECEVSFESVLP